jgi:predicted HicB family RNase H-like nuclease
MATLRTTKKSAGKKKFLKRHDFRFVNEDHYELVQQARKHVNSTSMNGWIVQATTDYARRQLAQ